MLNLKKRKLKALSQDAAVIPSKMTKHVGGADGAYVNVGSDQFATITPHGTIIQTGPTDPDGPYTGTITNPSTITGPGTIGTSKYF
ncbi:hypothetical protein [Pseudoalteromonas luteoviolacea]|uniref:Uncharacterized protein n=1 Tax=Pseudoalteromonas luteoviolacea H33 TaxID=1365251 RepID=A0A167FQR1_9GAMM|nr:hypothetical protein [Pseudoalteromonas luteoviolacea]KZN52648.1 hypothetical protein N476_09980 [Pseudoalteromonas luteoviolacea H33]KZN78229.1 hypothetical protein N477_10270 [Pseudoalteromonas luteoviolacea H33-S]MBQ4880353.1 hypothetical protein [Pseudoalteromonas luteoviolacea]MBQ4909420.1 hypothetical protein [Pseudoalteromonas luteoviolacea]